MRTRFLVLLLASCSSAQGVRPPATSVINDQHTTGGTGPVTSAQAYVAPPTPEAPPPQPLPTASRTTAPQQVKAEVKAEVTECRRAKTVVAETEPVCAVHSPRATRSRTSRRHAP